MIFFQGHTGCQHPCNLEVFGEDAHPPKFLQMHLFLVNYSFYMWCVLGTFTSVIFNGEDEGEHDNG